MTSDDFTAGLPPLRRAEFLGRRAGRALVGWIVTKERSGQFTLSLLVVDFLLFGFVFKVSDGYWLARQFSLATLALLAAGWLYYRLFRRHRSGILDEHRA